MELYSTRSIIQNGKFSYSSKRTITKIYNTIKGNVHYSPCDTSLYKQFFGIQDPLWAYETVETGYSNDHSNGFTYSANNARKVPH